MYQPRERRLTENGDRNKEAELARTTSGNDKRSVFQRLNSGAGKVAVLPSILPIFVTFFQLSRYNADISRKAGVVEMNRSV